MQVSDETSIGHVHSLAGRTRRALRRGGLETVGQVRRTSDFELLRIPGIGKLSLRDIRECLGCAPAEGVPASMSKLPLRDTLFIGRDSRGRPLVATRGENRTVLLVRLPADLDAGEGYPVISLSADVAQTLARWFTREGGDVDARHRTCTLTPRQVCRLLGLRVPYPRNSPSRLEKAVALVREGFSAEEVRRVLGVRSETKDAAAIDRIAELVSREASSDDDESRTAITD